MFRAKRPRHREMGSSAHDPYRLFISDNKPAGSLGTIAQPEPLTEVGSLASAVGSEVSSVPQRLQWTASLSYSESPQEEHLWSTRVGRNSTCTIRTNKLTPTIIIKIESNRPAVPVMSPNPVVVSIATVK